MNFKFIRKVLSRILLLEASFFLLPILISFYYGEPFFVRKAYYLTIGMIVLFAGLLMIRSDTEKSFYAKEGMVTVALSWILLSFFGAMPFYLSGEIPSFIDAFFESTSGFTTTGASILTNVEAMSRSLLFWRSFTHLVGGMGILVFALAVLPKTTNQNVHLMKAEVPGPTFGKLVPKATYTARILYIIYFAMTGILILILWMEGMPFFDSCLNAFGAAGTGGFGIKNNSIAAYNNPAAEITLAVAMLLFGINFNLYYYILAGKVREVLKSEETRWYLGIMGLATLFFFLNLSPFYEHMGTKLRDSFFTVTSVMTTTGYSTADFGTWPVFSQSILLILMFIGGCAGSTAGGLKVSRIIILVKSAIREIRRSINPKRVLSIRSEGKAVDRTVVTAVKDYLLVYLAVFIILVLLVSITAPDFLSAFSAVAATINNIGPGLGVVGPSSSYAMISGVNKILLSFAMLAGRLEIFPILILLAPSTWKK